jgi:NAD(P)H-nitrite reductase large subunit
MVSEREIILALKKGVKETADIQRITRAGTSCGRCLMIIDQIVEEFSRIQPRDLQCRMKFEE